jgi:hypothetical protein
MSRRSARALTITSLESLEDRIALSTVSATNPWESLVETKGGPALGVIYTEYFNYVQSGSQGTFLSAQSNEVEMIGPTVGVELQFSSGSNFAANATMMQQAGLIETASFPSLNIVEGFMPIGQLPAIAPDPNLTTLAPVYKPNQNPIPSATTSPATTAVALKGGPALASIYQEYLNYVAAGGTGTFTPVEAGQIEFSGTSVGVAIDTPAADFNAMLGAMEVYGMKVTATAMVGQIGVIEGFLPIAQLPTVATNGDLVGMNPIYRQVSF